VKYIEVSLGSNEAAAGYGMIPGPSLGAVPFVNHTCLGVGLGSVIKKRRKKMRKHKHKKMLKKTRWARRAHA
jgi:hypothetical protein